MPKFSIPLRSAWFKGRPEALIRGKKRRPPLVKNLLVVLICLLPALTWLDPVAAAFPGTNGVPQLPGNQAAYTAWLLSIGRPVYSRYHGYLANYSIYEREKLLVYGDPASIPGNVFDRFTGQYKLLGYSYDEIILANPLFHEEGGEANPTTPWDWIEKDLGLSATISWARLTSREKELIKSARLTCKNNAYGYMTFSQLDLTEKTTVVLAPPSWHMGFALYTRHQSDISSVSSEAAFYGRGEGQVSVINSILLETAPSLDGCYVIGREAEKIDIAYQISGQITTFNGSARESDIHNRGVGNSQGWLNGTGIGPWTKRMILSVSRQDLGGLRRKQLTIQGYAWVVSKMGDVELCRTEKSLTVRVETEAPPFNVEIGIQGSLHYFSGQTNLQGLTMPFDPHRFLQFERLKIILDFTRDPLNLEYTFNGVVRKLTTIAGKRHYEATLTIQNAPTTLTWHGIRLNPPLCLKVKANSRLEPAKYVEGIVEDIEITGSIYDIAYAQLSP